MKHLLWLYGAVCLASWFSIVRGEFFALFEDYQNGNETGNNNDVIGEAISGVKEYFGSLTDTLGAGDPDTERRQNKTASASVSASAPESESVGFDDEVDMALKHATDTADGLWQQFKKGLLSLMGSFSAGDGGNDIDGYNPTAATTPTTDSLTMPMAVSITTPTPSLQQIKPIANPTSTTIGDSVSTTTPTPTPTTIALPETTTLLPPFPETTSSSTLAITTTTPTL